MPTMGGTGAAGAGSGPRWSVSCLSTGLGSGDSDPEFRVDLCVRTGGAVAKYGDIYADCAYVLRENFIYELK